MLFAVSLVELHDRRSDHRHLLLGLAVPQYSDYLRRAKLTDGTALLANYQVSVEQYYQDNRNYGLVINGPVESPRKYGVFFSLHVRYKP